MDLLAIVSNLGIGSVVGWGASVFLGTPIRDSIKDFRAIRNETLRIGTQYVTADWNSSKETVSRGLSAIDEVGNKLAAIWATRGLVLTLWCKMNGYDPDLAEGVLKGISHMVGAPASSEMRNNQIDALRLALGVRRGFSRERIVELQTMVAEARSKTGTIAAMFEDVRLS